MKEQLQRNEWGWFVIVYSDGYTYKEKRFDDRDEAERFIKKAEEKGFYVGY